MKKIKLISSLTSLFAIAVATPIVATSCSNNQTTNKIELHNYHNIDKVAIGDYACDLVYITKNGVIQPIRELTVKSSDEKVISVSAQAGVGGPSTEYYIIISGVDAEATDRVVITITATDYNNNTVEVDYDVTAVEPEYEISMPKTIGNVNYGNALASTEVPLIIKNSGNWTNNITEEQIEVTFKDADGEDVTDAFTALVQVPSDIINFDPYYIIIQINTDALPKFGEYEMEVVVTDEDGEEIFNQASKFNLVDGFDISVNNDQVKWTRRNCTLSVHNNGLWPDDMVANFNLAPNADTPETEIEYSLNKEVEGVSFNINTGQLTFATDISTLQEELTIAAWTEGEKLAELKFTLIVTQSA